MSNPVTNTIRHTPGPWIWLEADNGEDGFSGEPLNICGPDHDDLAQVFSDEDSTVNVTREQAIANARLITAAPELLSALENLLGFGTGGGMESEMAKDDARAAIAKATGAA